MSFSELLLVSIALKPVVSPFKKRFRSRFRKRFELRSIGDNLRSRINL